MEVKEKILTLDGREYSFLVPVNAEIKMGSYDSATGAKLIYLNASPALKAKTDTMKIENLLEWKFMSEDVHDFHASEEEIMEFLQKKSCEAGYDADRKDLEEILHLES